MFSRYARMLPRLNSVNRTVAAALAGVWIAAALAGLVIAYVANQWLVLPVALFALWYGFLWVRVAAEARVLTWTEAAAPWRARGLYGP